MATFLARNLGPDLREGIGCLAITQTYSQIHGKVTLGAISELLADVVGSDRSQQTLREIRERLQRELEFTTEALEAEIDSEFSLGTMRFETEEDQDHKGDG